MDGFDWSKMLAVLGGLFALAGTVLQAWRTGTEGYAAALTLNKDAWEVMSQLEPDPAAVERQRRRSLKYKRRFGYEPGRAPEESDQPAWKHYWEAAGVPLVLIGIGSVLAIVGTLIAH